MHFTYVIIPALSLLNIGVEGATIAQALTSRHSSEAQQVRGIVHGRQFRNADFDSPVAQATRHSTRSELVDNAANKTASSIKGPNDLEENAAINPQFTDYVEDSVSKDSQNAQDKTFSDSTTGSLNTDKLLSLPVVGTDSLFPSDLAPLLSDAFNRIPSHDDVVSEVLPARREDDDSDQVQEVVKELESVSTSPTNPSTLEGNSVTPQASERRFLRRKRDDGSLSANVGGEPMLQLDHIYEDPSGAFGPDVNIRSPIATPRDDKPSHLQAREDIANLDVKALEDKLNQSEDIGSSSG